MDQQIDALHQPTIIYGTESKTVRVKHSLSCTMIDGKVCGALAGMLFLNKIPYGFQKIYLAKTPLHVTVQVFLVRGALYVRHTRDNLRIWIRFFRFQ